MRRGRYFPIRMLSKAPLRDPLPSMTRLTQQKFKHNGHQTHKDKKHYQVALNRLEMIFDAKLEPPAGDELEVLGILIDKYEQEHPYIGYPDPIEAFKFRMEQLG